ncbi:MAG TPA: type II toxin-antitoxin system VapC family toxin [Vicinamibacterales bacterium]|nr:type II toxin-antitoxin system VapC family toxin [Vicinamibacterales bacterium]
MKYLLDTQAWVWSVLDHPRLSRRVRAALQAVSADERVGIAAISLKEAAWHLARGRIVVDKDFGPWPLWLRTAASSPRIEVLPLTADVAIESEHLGEAFPPDPADCLIAATARVHDLTLITPDRPIRKSGAVRTFW